MTCNTKQDETTAHGNAESVNCVPHSHNEVGVSKSNPFKVEAQTVRMLKWSKQNVFINVLDVWLKIPPVINIRFCMFISTAV